MTSVYIIVTKNAALFILIIIVISVVFPTNVCQLWTFKWRLKYVRQQYVHTHPLLSSRDIMDDSAVSVNEKKILYYYWWTGELVRTLTGRLPKIPEYVEA